MAPALHRRIPSAVMADAITLLGFLRPFALTAAAIAAIANPGRVHAASVTNASEHPYSPHVAQASVQFGIPENWIWAVMRQESGGNARARSPVGAQGLMQIMPATWAMLTARYGLGSDPYDVRANIHAGAAYLRLMWDRYRDPRLMLAAYNAGPGRTDAYAAGRRGLPTETITYVSRIAPSLGTSGIASLGPVPSLPVQSWRSASVFIAHNKDASYFAAAPSSASIPGSPNGRSETVLNALQPAHNALFFNLSGTRP